MNTVLVVFFSLGLLFGWFTWPHRHLFSEGHTRRGRPGEDDGPGQRVVWVLVCSALWPLFALTGLYSAVHRARARARVAPPPRRR